MLAPLRRLKRKRFIPMLCDKKETQRAASLLIYFCRLADALEHVLALFGVVANLGLIVW